MKITTKGRYGIRAVLFLASTSYNRPVSIRKIAREEEISPEFLEQIFFQLKKAGIITSHRGPGGGFILSRKTSDITVMDILLALDEKLSIVPCKKPAPCKRVQRCIAQGLWNDLSEIIRKYLADITIKDILEKNRKKYYEELESGINFTI